MKKDINPRIWSHALRIGLGYPAERTVEPTIAFTFGAPRSNEEAVEVVQLAVVMATDLVYIEVEQIGMEPTGISLAIRHADKFEWLSGCEVYAADDDSPFRLLAASNSWSVGPRLILTKSELPTEADRTQGVERAMRRWRAIAAATPPLSLEGVSIVPNLLRYADRHVPGVFHAGL